MFGHGKSVAIGVVTAAFAFSAVVGATAAFGSGTGSTRVSSAAAGPGQPAPARLRRNARPAFQVAGAISEMGYVPVVSCVLVDTRLAGGPLANGATRSYDARGTGSFVGQGGSKTGCGIPTNAAALALNVLAVTPRAAGHIKVLPYRGAGTGTIVVYYNAGQTISGSVNADIAAPGSHAFTIINLGGPSDVVADVTGYYIAPLAAEVTGTGTLVHGSRVTATSGIATGQYEIDFDRDVSNCFYSAAPNISGVLVDVQPRDGTPSGVFVELTTTTGTAINTQFFLTVAC